VPWKLAIRDERARRRRAREQWDQHDASLRAVCDKCLGETSLDAKRNYLNLTMMYHSLGASRTAAILAIVGATAYVASHDQAILLDNFAEMVLVTIHAGLISMFVAVVCHRNRIDARTIANRRLEAALRLNPPVATTGGTTVKKEDG
jgi:uncharacterized membrane protein YcgQ (UPF0703/DUF1980 family)